MGIEATPLRQMIRSGIQWSTLGVEWPRRDINVSVEKADGPCPSEDCR